MCFKQTVEYHSSSESINHLQDLNLEWPIKGKNCSNLIVACNFCYYPITFEENVIAEIRNDINISFGIVIPIRKIFKKVTISDDNPIEQWRTEVYCPNCGIILSFLSIYRYYLTETNFAKIKHCVNVDEQIVILWTYPLYRGSAIEAKSCFEFFNELKAQFYYHNL